MSTQAEREATLALRGELCPGCGFQGDLHAHEYAYGSPCHYDGISEWVCPACGTRVGRWSGRILIGQQLEPPFGRGYV